ncbi:MAG: hypothetical protein ACMUJM_06715 [bacterium]
MQKTVQIPWDVKPVCHYEDHTPDIEGNKIFAWALFHITQSGMHTERVLPKIRQSYQALQGFVSLFPCSPRPVSDDYIIA